MKVASRQCRLKKNRIEETNKVEETVEIDKGKNIKILIKLIAKKMEQNANDVIRVKNNVCRVINEIMNEWTEKEMVINIVD